VYRIHVAAKNAGVSTQLLRAWERRYGLVHPQRSTSGYRVYTEGDVVLLRGAKVLVDQGRSISEVARLPRKELELAGLQRPVVPLAIPPSGTFLDSALAAIGRFDGQTLDTILFQAMGMGSLTAPEACHRVLLPLLEAIGDRWEAGTLSIAAEHFGSSQIRRRMHDLLASESRRAPEAAPVVCATLEGDLHEGGILAFAIHTASSRHPVVYLGTGTPLKEVLATASARSAKAIALSFGLPWAPGKFKGLCRRLATWKADGVDRAVYLGGRGALPHREAIEKAGLLFLAEARYPGAPA